MTAPFKKTYRMVLEGRTVHNWTYVDLDGNLRTFYLPKTETHAPPPFITITIEAREHGC
jgi:hypothetical protein